MSRPDLVGLTNWRMPLRVGGPPQGTAHGICEDYRTASGIDLVHDAADRNAGRMLAMPVLAPWARDGVINRCFDPRLTRDRLDRC